MSKWTNSNNNTSTKRVLGLGKVKGQFKQVELKLKKEYQVAYEGNATYCFFFNAQEHNVQKSQG